MTWTGPGFVDNHSHALAIAAQIPPPWETEGVEEYHHRLHRAGMTPFEDQINLDLPPDLYDRFVDCVEQAAATGLVGVNELGAQSWQFLETLKQLREDDCLPLAVSVFMAPGLADVSRMQKIGDDRLELAGAKFYADGWSSARTCAVSEPFADRPGETGILFLDTEELLRRAAPVAEAGFTIATHAIGDRAITNVLDAYERLYGSDCAAAAPRIEHCSIMTDELIDRFVELGVVASIQSSFAVSEQDDLAAALGDRLPLVYRWADLIDRGVRVLGGSDFPVETANPLEGLRDLSTGAVVNDQTIGRLSREQALALLTDGTIGTMELSRDPLTTPVDQLADIEIIKTQLVST